jgi:cytochrome c oxidase subunit III
MTAATAGLRTERRPSILGVGTVVWLTSELMFFAGLFAAYFTLRSVNADWPPGGVELETARTGLATLVLVGSSFTMHLAVRAAEHGDRRTAVRWVLVTAGLGTLFLANQAGEYAAASFQVESHAYGSIFYLMTGFHGLHVVAGIVLMLVAVGVIAGRSRAPAADVLGVTAYYWHFVDVVWVAMFTTIYLVR